MPISIGSTDALLTTAKQNPGIFNALFARAPKSINYGGKTYLRDGASSIEQKLWYLAASARTQPSSLATIAAGSYSLDEVYGLDPDRSDLDAANASLREAQATANKVKAKVDALKRQIKSFQEREKDAQKRSKDCEKVTAGSIFTLGISNAGCKAYEDGQVQLWRDRIQAWKSGAMVGMAGQEGMTVPVNDGLSQNEGLLLDAKAAVKDAQANVKAAQARYDAEAKQMRDDEAQARIAAAKDAADAERTRQQELFLQQQATSAANTQYAAQDANYASANSYASSQTDPGYVYDDGSYAGGDYDDGGGYVEGSSDDLGGAPGDAAWYEQLDGIAETFGLSDQSELEDYAEDYLGLDAPSINDLGYISPYSFDSYYTANSFGADDCDCASCDDCAGDDAHASFKLAMLDAGWGRFGYDSVNKAYFADKITEEGDQGSSGLPSAQSFLTTGSGANDAPFDFGSIIPLIITAIIALAPLIINAFMPPVHTAEANPPKSVLAESVPPPAPAPRPAPGFFDSIPEPILWGGLALAAAKLLG